MMSGELRERSVCLRFEKSLVVGAVSVVVVCLTVVYVFTFVSLWAYKELVGASLLLLVVGTITAAVWVRLRGRLIEQQLRQVRYHHHEEIPLDVAGEPYYWPGEVQENPYHVSSQKVAMREPLQW